MYIGETEDRKRKAEGLYESDEVADWREEITRPYSKFGIPTGRERSRPRQPSSGRPLLCISPCLDLYVFVHITDSFQPCDHRGCRCINQAD